MQIDGQVNPTLQSVHLERFPINTAHFTRDGTEVVIAGQRKSFFVYDMVAGKITRVPGIRGASDIILIVVCVFIMFILFQAERNGSLISLLSLLTTSFWFSSAKMAICLLFQTR